MAPDAFHAHIRSALADPNLQEALDNNAERRLRAREQAFLSLPEPWVVMRQRAHRLRAEVIANLDHYLDQFITKAQSNGMTLHRATDANAANEIVLEIAKKNKAKLIAKSKTMVSEEIGLNHALQAEGLRVVETDLGEYIVQLRGEPPAHIITPAVHLRRQEIGQTFHEKLGVHFTEDISTLTSVARKALRQVFLEADIGLSGVNFGVADTGTICIITNEGNGRMVTSVPPIHIALMGIERLVPTLDDLALMLYLLPRSATGQKTTVYTSLIHGPVTSRSHSKAFGPRERHLILVDNGRTSLRNSPLAEALYCIRCGACLNACPVFQEIGGHAYVNTHGESSTYPGPIGSVISPGLFGESEFGYLARASSLCGACKEACPVDIDLPKLLLRIRAGQTPDNPHAVSGKTHTPNTPTFLAWGLRLYTWMAVEPKRFATFQKVANIVGSLSPAWLRLPAFTGWGYSKDLPSPPRQPFRERWLNMQIDNQKRKQTGDQDYKETANKVSRLKMEATIEENFNSANSSAVANIPKYKLLDRFEQELTALEGHFIHCTSSALSEQVLNLLREKDIHSILTWEEKCLPSNIIKDLISAGIKVRSTFDATDLKNARGSESKIPRAGITGAIAAVAETGTLVLPGGDGRLPAASLLPEIHIAIFNFQDLYPNLSSVLHLNEVLKASSTALISGPSRTADIEMTLTIGVHGPRELHVFCVDD